MAADARRLALAVVELLILAIAFMALPGQHAAQAAEIQPTLAQAASYDNAALSWAEANATGAPYVYGGTGPGYDCSGLVYTAFAHVGISLPRDTYEMLADTAQLHPIPVADAQRGDLLFYGDGHVEFDTIWHDTSFGAHDTGTQVGWITWGPYWYPTMAFVVT
jgi:cell wall-associated NlpC family hydrolase